MHSAAPSFQLRTRAENQQNMHKAQLCGDWVEWKNVRLKQVFNSSSGRAEAVLSAVLRISIQQPFDWEESKGEKLVLLKTLSLSATAAVKKLVFFLLNFPPNPMAAEC